MSGLYLPGMEMPTRCWDCLLNTYGYCMASDHSDIIPSDAPIPDWCPLVPVPEHGDLIDRGYAIATACSGRIRALPTTEDGEDWIRVNEVRESIKSAPTIIPAEEGEG